jgi:hypothetical protein
VQIFTQFGPEGRGWLRQRPVTIIMAIAIVFMTAVNLEQSRVIDAQRSLIQLLSGDSSELAMRRIQQMHRHR